MSSLYANYSEITALSSNWVATLAVESRRNQLHGIVKFDRLLVNFLRQLAWYADGTLPGLERIHPNVSDLTCAPQPIHLHTVLTLLMDK